MTITDIPSLQEKLLSALSPIGKTADLRPQFPSTQLDISSPKPTITASIKSVEIYNLYQSEQLLPFRAVLEVGIYVPKRLESALCYDLFSEVATLLSMGEFNLQSVGCSQLEYLPDLRHYHLAVTAELRPEDIEKEAADGNTDL